MTRFSAAILFGLGLGLCVAGAGRTQDLAPADRCFPWQEFRNGVCVAKTAPLAPPPFPAAQAPSLSPAPAESSATTPPLVCPPSFHADGGACITDTPPAPPRAPITITCNGGTASNGQCTCPAGFELMPAGTDPGGSCVRINAENCLGGQMTVTGECLCSGQVTMSGQVYDLEFARGKCIPKICPRDGPCITAAAKPDGAPPPTLSSSEPEPHRACGRGMVATRYGCVALRHRSQTIDPGAYFRTMPNYPSPMHY
ncbi:hypothetical protein [Bradyrhizobium commune]|uniref:EGF-like domain-containing protein n=1 Tax=Bradyrhizobium commune TaxID=83627 RepID=A0A7S9H2C6_9BRAD|nr:hypothetical protein [Bradyrhizobium commune]QPF94920.1 hypothetical protein IC761_17320 [Bradyrhizobium commune]